MEEYGIDKETACDSISRKHAGEFIRDWRDYMSENRGEMDRFNAWVKAREKKSEERYNAERNRRENIYDDDWDPSDDDCDCEVCSGDKDVEREPEPSYALDVLETDIFTFLLGEVKAEKIAKEMKKLGYDPKVVKEHLPKFWLKWEEIRSEEWAKLWVMGKQEVGEEN